MKVLSTPALSKRGLIVSHTRGQLKLGASMRIARNTTIYDNVTRMKIWNLLVPESHFSLC